jgi:hypothetical protein
MAVAKRRFLMLKITHLLVSIITVVQFIYTERGEMTSCQEFTDDPTEHLDCLQREQYQKSMTGIPQASVEEIVAEVSYCESTPMLRIDS